MSTRAITTPMGKTLRVPADPEDPRWDDYAGPFYLAWGAPHTIYRLFDADGVLLYVGKTRDFSGRMVYHQRPWYGAQAAAWDYHDQIHHWALEEVLGGVPAAQAELEAIANEWPLYNRQRPASTGWSGAIASRWTAPTP